MEYLSVGECAKRIGARPQDITEIIYKGKLCNEDFPLVAGRRLIPASHVDLVIDALCHCGRRVSKTFPTGDNHG